MNYTKINWGLTYTIVQSKLKIKFNKLTLFFLTVIRTFAIKYCSLSFNTCLTTEILCIIYLIDPNNKILDNLIGQREESERESVGTCYSVVIVSLTRPGHRGFEALAFYHHLRRAVGPDIYHRVPLVQLSQPKCCIRFTKC